MQPLASAQKKITSLEQVLASIQPLRTQYPLVTTNGCYDLLHTGHLTSLAYAAELSPYVVVLVNSDSSVATIKGPNRPIVPQQDRALALACIGFVWRVVLFTEDTPLACLEKLQPSYHVKGQEYANQNLPEKKLLENHGGKLVYAPVRQGIRTSELIARIQRPQ